VAGTTPTGRRTATPTRTPPRCVGDCNFNGQVSVDELIRSVGITLGTLQISACDAWDDNRDGAVAIPELIAAVSNAIYGCFVTPPTRRPTSTRTPTLPATSTASATGTNTLSPTITMTPSITGTPTRTATAAVGTIVEDLRPCFACDQWRFAAAADQTYIVRVDTSNPATPADLGLTITCCDDVDCEFASGDDEFTCLYPAPFDYGCPEAAIRVVANSTCYVEVMTPSGYCLDEDFADYSMTVVHFNTERDVPTTLAVDDGYSDGLQCVPSIGF
jgi:hypothetical protein